LYHALPKLSRDRTSHPQIKYKFLSNFIHQTTISVLINTTKKNISPVLTLHGPRVGKPSEVMVTMTTSTAIRTPPRHSAPSPNTSQSPSTRDVSPKQKSEVWSYENDCSDNLNSLRDSPTKNPNLPTAAAADLNADNDDNTTAPGLTFEQERNEFIDEFNAFYEDFLPFYNKYAHTTSATLRNEAATSSLESSTHNGDKDGPAAQQRRVFAELDDVNRQLSQLLDVLENPAPCQQPKCATCNLQQPAQFPESLLARIPECATTGSVPPAPDPAPTIIVLSTFPRPQQSTMTTIPNETTMMVADCILPKLPPPAPDPEESMAYDGVSLWPLPRPVAKTTPFKKKFLTKHTRQRRTREKDSFRPP